MHSRFKQPPSALCGGPDPHFVVTVRSNKDRGKTNLDLRARCGHVSGVETAFAVHNALANEPDSRGFWSSLDGLQFAPFVSFGYARESVCGKGKLVYLPGIRRLYDLAAREEMDDGG